MTNSLFLIKVLDRCRIVSTLWFIVDLCVVTQACHTRAGRSTVSPSKAAFEPMAAADCKSFGTPPHRPVKRNITRIHSKTHITISYYHGKCHRNIVQEIDDPLFFPSSSFCGGIRRRSNHLPGEQNLPFSNMPHNCLFERVPRMNLTSKPTRWNRPSFITGREGECSNTLRHWKQVFETVTSSIADKRLRTQIRRYCRGSKRCYCRRHNGCWIRKDFPFRLWCRCSRRGCKSNHRRRVGRRRRRILRRPWGGWTGRSKRWAAGWGPEWWATRSVQRTGRRTAKTTAPSSSRRSNGKDSSRHLPRQDRCTSRG